MKFGVREICDVVLRAKGTVKVGDTTFQNDEPVIYFDSAKTSSVEGSATTVYATGGRGNNKLLAWEGEKAVTFTMEDALLSPLGFSILSGAGLVDASVDKKVSMHTVATSIAAYDSSATGFELDLASIADIKEDSSKSIANEKAYAFIMENGQIIERLEGAVPSSGVATFTRKEGAKGVLSGEYTIMTDFYIEAQSGAMEMTIEPDKFGGFYYLEASTLFRRQDTGQDMAAAFVIPKVKIQSNFTFSMASSGDPSTFTFTMDAFPDYTKFDQTKQVLFALQILE